MSIEFERELIFWSWNESFYLTSKESDIFHVERSKWQTSAAPFPPKSLLNSCTCGPCSFCSHPSILLLLSFSQFPTLDTYRAARFLSLLAPFQKPNFREPRGAVRDAPPPALGHADVGAARPAHLHSNRSYTTNYGITLLFYANYNLALKDFWRNIFSLLFFMVLRLWKVSLYNQIV